MIPKYHIITGAIISFILYLIFPITPLQASIIFISSFLIDIDHYFYYAFKNKSLNPVNATKWFFKKRKIWLQLSPIERKKYKRAVIIFHGIEFWMLLLVLSFFNKIFVFILIGIAIHMLLDFIEIIYLNEPFYCKFSQMYVCLKNKNKTEFKSFYRELN